MKKKYIQPTTIQVRLAHRVSILNGSIHTTDEGGHATFYNEDASSEALTKQSSVWDEDWSGK